MDIIVMGGEMRKRGRRHWADEEKLRMMTEARTSGQSTSAVARRNGVNANQLFNWLRDPRLLALLDRLHRKRMIMDPVGKTKSMILTEEGLARSRELLHELFAKSSK